MINVKTNWRNFFGILIICLLIRKINTYIFGRTTQYTFTVWQCIIWLWICKYCCFCHIICFGINMTPMWHDCIFICFIYVIWFFVRPFVLSIIGLIFDFFCYQSRHDSNDEYILLEDIQHSWSHMTLYISDIFIWGGNSECNVESLIMILFSAYLASLSPPYDCSLAMMLWSYQR